MPAHLDPAPAPEPTEPGESGGLRRDEAEAREVAASDLVAACEAGWAAIQTLHPQVPDTVIVLGTGVERGRLVKLGHWWGGQWRVGAEARGEVLLAGEALHLPPEAVFEVLLHEAAHGLAAARNIRDTSRGGRYHNANYKAVAAEVGLRPRRLDPYGFARTELTPVTAETYADVIAGIGARMRLARGLPARRAVGVEGGVEGIAGGGREADGGRTNGSKSGPPAAECGCEPGRKLRMAPSVLERGPVICGLCGSEFTVTRQAEARVAASPGAGLAEAMPGMVGSTGASGRFTGTGSIVEVLGGRRPTGGTEAVFDLRTIELPVSRAGAHPDRAASWGTVLGVSPAGPAEPLLPEVPGAGGIP